MSTPYWPPPPIDVLDRVDATPAHTQHPKDHNDLQVAVNAILLALGQQPYGQSDTLTAELVRLQHLLTNSGGNAALQKELDDLKGVVDSIQSYGIPQLYSLFYGLRYRIEQLEAGSGGGQATLSHYVHRQSSNASTWQVQHNLGYDPVIEVVTDDGLRLLGFDLAYADDHMSVTLGFSQAITGRALLSN